MNTKPITNTRRTIVALAAALAFPIYAGQAVTQATPINISDVRPDDARFRKMSIQGVEVAYREAGNPQNPSIVLLHGFPTSSHMYRDLIPMLAKNYHVIAPDYPGFGASDMPSMDQFDYSFAKFAEVIDELLQKKGIDRYAMYVMDYGAPVGFRLFAKHPDRVSGFIIQNGNAYAEGLQKFWDPLKAYWANPSAQIGEQLREGLLSLKATQWQWTHGIPKEQLELVSPDNWHHDQFLLDRPGNKDIQLVLFKSYGTNVAEYPKWQALFREHQPPALIVWGKGDKIFPPAGAHPYERDLKSVEKHILNTGHFALETHSEFIAARIHNFMDRTAP